MRGGSYAVFDQRPLSQEVMDYCIQDVTLMPHMRQVYRSKLCDAWWQRIDEETEARIRLSQSANYNGQGRHMAEGPKDWLHWTPSPKERLSRTLFEEDEIQRASNAPRGSTNLGVDEVGAQLSVLCIQAKNDQRELLWQDSPSDNDSDGGVWAYGDSYLDGDEDDGTGDLTACDSECGYCGRCPY